MSRGRGVATLRDRVVPGHKRKTRTTPACAVTVVGPAARTAERHSVAGRTVIMTALVVSRCGSSFRRRPRARTRSVWRHRRQHRGQSLRRIRLRRGWRPKVLLLQGARGLGSGAIRIQFDQGLSGLMIDDARRTSLIGCVGRRRRARRDGFSAPLILPLRGRRFEGVSPGGGWRRSRKAIASRPDNRRLALEPDCHGRCASNILRDLLLAQEDERLRLVSEIWWRAAEEHIEAP